VLLLELDNKNLPLYNFLIHLVLRLSYIRLSDSYHYKFLHRYLYWYYIYHYFHYILDWRYKIQRYSKHMKSHLRYIAESHYLHSGSLPIEIDYRLSYQFHHHRQYRYYISHYLSYTRE
jgi:hypothetical protein